MEFDLSKENIQPLRGGRNRAQLEVALQAQADTELHRELIEQRHEYENIIKTYNGDDPLDNWYCYISWLEQSYPKHGHEGNLLQVLEDCLNIFENDHRYMHDRRMCKLWIKYIDLQQNPDELFQLLHSKDICVSCADLYRAWAFYHEIAGDYKRANAVYQLGLQALAQPYEDLEQAQKNMFMAAGKQIVQEMDEQVQQQIEEQRRALTSLRSYKHKTVVASTRVGQEVLKSTPGHLPLTSKPRTKSNKKVPVYVDENNEGAVGGCSRVVKSILEVARRKEVIKENTLKPGPWTVLKPKKKAGLHHLTPTFKVHEDDLPEETSVRQIKLYPNFCTTNMDDYSSWEIPICVPEPDDPKKISMYPKNLIYTENKEYSIEEIKARKYEDYKFNNSSVSDPRTTSNETNIHNLLTDSSTLQNFTIFEDENKSIEKNDEPLKKSFEIFTDIDEDCSKTPTLEINNFTIYEDGGENCSQSQTVSLKQNTGKDQSGINFTSNLSSDTASCSTDINKEVKNKNKFCIYTKKEQIETKCIKNQHDKMKSLNLEKHAQLPAVLRGHGSTSLKDDLNSLIPRGGFVLGRDKSENQTNSKIKEHVRSLIAKQPTQESCSGIIKLDKSSFNTLTK